MLFFRTFALTIGLALLLVRPATAAEQDFWQWLRPQFQLSEIHHPEIDRWEKRYRRRHLELEVILEDGKDFLYPLALAVADRGMPLEIALLPIIESHLDPTAVSESGARGLWQLLPPTAEHLGLKHDWWLDESADYAQSTKAALDYLSYLHDRFGGWLLSLAAYNGGEGRVWRKLHENHRKGLSTDLWDLNLPRQTEVYIPKLLGLAKVIAEPRGIKLPKLKTVRSFTQVTLDFPLDVAQIAELADISIEHVYRLNPQLLRWSMHPEGPHNIYLPLAVATKFRQRSAKLPAPQRRQWHKHQVRIGESVASIANDHKADIDLIRATNPFRHDQVKVGNSIVLISGKPKLESATRRAVLERKRLDYAPRPLPPGVHKVASGESLWTIARRYRTSVANLQALNELGPKTALVPGQLLDTGRTSGGQRMTYTVRQGDALSLIASRFNIRVSDIQRWNQLDTSLLHPGQKLKLQFEG